MLVTTARVMGFCGGVRRAMRIAVDAAMRNGGLQAEGMIVHNRQAVTELERHGVVVSPDLDRGLPVLIRAHGAAPERTLAWRQRGLRLIDATCPHVAANQEAAAAAREKGERVLFAGDPEHAETRAVAGSAGADCLVVTQCADLNGVAGSGPFFLLSQTTFDVKVFEEISSEVLRRWPGSRVADTICRATRDRQDAVRELAREVDAVVVVGGRESANTRRLADVVRSGGRPVFLVETADDLDADALRAFTAVGVTAGASTPDWVTEAVVERLREL